MNTYVLKMENQDIIYEYKKNKRGRRISISVKSGGRVVVSAPRLVNRWLAEKFLAEKKDWVLRALNKIKSQPPRLLAEKNRNEYLKLKESARRIIMAKIIEINKIYNFKFNRVAIRDQSTRWGSCSKQGNLNFSYKVVKLPEFALNYIVIHELCHLREFNHSPKFWELVRIASPEYKKARKLLKEI
jgi:predicted metal-dependent hydrolase